MVKQIFYNINTNVDIGQKPNPFAFSVEFH